MENIRLNSLSAPTPIPVYNNSSTDTIPAFALMQLNGDAGDIVPANDYAGYGVVTAPTSDNLMKTVINGSVPILPKQPGICYYEVSGLLAYDPTDGVPNSMDPDENWGPKSGEFLARKGYLGFKAASTERAGLMKYFRTFEGLSGADLDKLFPPVISRTNLIHVYCDENKDPPLQEVFECWTGRFTVTPGRCGSSSSGSAGG